MTSSPAVERDYVDRYSIAMFFVLTLLLGAGIIYLVAQGVIPSELFLLSVLSVTIAGIIMTAVEDGKAGLKLLWRRLLIWRVKFGYWLFALFFLVPAIMLGSVVNPLFNGDPIAFNNIQPLYSFIPLFFIFVIVAGIGEELGWSGFLTPRLQARYTALTTSLIRAVLVCIWHLPLFVYSSLGSPSFADLHYAGWISQLGLLQSLVAFTFFFLLPWSIFSTWIFNNTRGSLLLVAVLHGSEVWAAYWMVNAGIDPANFGNWWGYGAILLAAAGAIVLINGVKELSLKHERIAH
jgi:membrane protease YdiL (CAAX protease family)